jgi:hypothetical protein
VKKYNWLYVAAGFLGFLFIGTMLFTQTEEMTDAANNKIVIENNSKDSSRTVKKQDVIDPVIENNTANTAVASGDKSAGQSSSFKTIRRGPYRANENQITANTDQINQNDGIAESQSDPNQIINQKTEQKITTLSYVNVDELLASVEETKKEKAQKPTLKVSPGSLLSQVDGELDLSFREKVIKAANKQYKNVRVALSNRNTQE